jgi:ribosomal protein L37AE/L43A
MGAKASKESEVRVGTTPCELCGKKSVTQVGYGTVLCATCSELTKTGAVIEPSIRQAPEHLVKRLTK